MKNTCFQLFKIDEIKPCGWLKKQLKIQAKGLSKTLPEFWPDIKDSAWIGGNAEGWERVPYWLDGVIVLAYLLDDEHLKAMAKKYIKGIVSAQCDDGWICPTDNRESYDMWAYILILKVFAVYHRASGDDTIIEPAKRALLCLDRHIDGKTLFNWGQTRWFEALIPIYWIYKHTGEDWLINLAHKLHAQGFDWKALFEIDYPYEKPLEQGRWSHMNHVVNNAMMLKGNALYHLISGNFDDFSFAEQAYTKLMKHHGMVTGVFTGDECLSGLNPFQGTELCSVAELMYSFELLVAITGDPIWADRLEKVAFNAFPATFSPDMTLHQYDQQINQPFCVVNPNPQYTTNGSESNLFGVEPNYGCCTANMHQGFPKFTASIYMYYEKSIVVNGYAPSALETGVFGRKVNLRQETDYPFNEKISFTLNCEVPLELTILLRIPNWAQSFECDINGECINGYYRVSQLFERETSFTLTLPMEAKLEERPGNMSVLTRGPLVYALNIDSRMKKQDKPNEPFWRENYEVYPESHWQYVMAIDDPKSLIFEKTEIGEFPFSPNMAGISVLVPCHKVKWDVVNLVPSISPDITSVSDEMEMVRFIPYGCTMLRMTELPNSQKIY